MLGLFAVTPAGAAEDPVQPLPALGAKLDETSVSGISSGAYMAGQFEFAHGRLVKGAAIIAGGPWGCAESLFADVMPGPGTAFLNLSKAINGCMLNALKPWGIPHPELLADKARRLAREGLIDPIDSVRDDRVYLFSGKDDHTVVPDIVAAAREFYFLIGLAPSQVVEISDLPAGHAFVTEDQGLACERSAKPFIVDCNYDQAGALLAHIYGKLNTRSAAPTGTFLVFDQNPFTSELKTHGLAGRGIVYVPSSCAASPGCKVHIAFHGCVQNEAAVGETFARESGFARWADTNKLIVLFPQTATTPLNPQGCWDWWGYTGHDFLTRDAPQIVAVHRMLQQLGAAGP